MHFPKKIILDFPTIDFMQKKGNEVINSLRNKLKLQFSHFNRECISMVTSPVSTTQAVTASRPTRLFSHVTKGKWVHIDDVKIGEGVDEKTLPGSRRNIATALTDCLTTSNLVILSGLGTSLCVNNSAGKTAPKMWDLWQAVHAQFTEIEKVKIAIHYSPPEGEENIEAFLSKCKGALDFLPENDANYALIKQFIGVAEKVIKSLVSFVDDETILRDHAHFLRKIARRSARKSRAKIFTTNYDLCFEVAASQCRFVVVDGFSHTLPQAYDPIYFSYDLVKRTSNQDTPDYIENVFQLYKLHGSIDWEKRKNGEIVRKIDVEEPLLIYPRASKYQQVFEPPYIDMMAAFQGALRQSDTALIIAGFGFNDDHISEPIMSALQANMNLKIVLIEPFFYKTESEDHSIDAGVLKNLKHRKLANLISAGDSRISLISSTFENFVELLPDLAAETDRERHAERYRKMREFENGE